MVEVTDSAMAKHVLMQAQERGVWGDVYDSVGLGEFGQHEFETEWSISDMDPSDCDVDMSDDTVVVSGQIEASYSVEVSKRTRHHPAEYETRTTPLFVSVEMKLGEIPVAPTINAEIA